MSGTQQFILALIVGVPAALSAIGAFIVSIVTLYRQGKIKTEMRDNHAEAQQAVVDVKASVDGLLDKRVTAAHAQGKSDQREETAADSIIIK